MDPIGENENGVEKRLQEYANSKKQAEEERMNVAPSERAIEEFEARLQATVDNLRQHVAEQREALENVSKVH